MTAGDARIAPALDVVNTGSATVRVVGRSWGDLTAPDTTVVIKQV